MTTLVIYVPASGAVSLAGVKPGSGIVGPYAPDDNGAIKVDYEGNLYGAVNMAAFEDRVYQAASRQLWNNGLGYPTVARRWVAPTDLVPIGSIEVDTETWRYRITITDQPSVDAWVAQYHAGR